MLSQHLPQVNFDRKISIYERQPRSRPGNITALDGLGYYLSRAGRHQEALAIYSQFLRRKSDAPGIWCNYGTVLEQLGYYSEAVETYKRALVVSPGYFKAMYGKSKNLYRH